jgi:N-acetylneuraminic acid mutarotase
MRAAVLDGAVIVPGGLGPDRTLGVVEAYRPADGAWRTLPPLPEPLHHAGVAAADGRLFVSGGYRDLRFVPVTDLWAYDPDDRAWRRLADLPEPRAGHALVAVDGALYVVGGIGRRSQAVWRYDIAAGRWTRPAADIPTVREHLAAVVLDGRIWAIGGRWPERGNLGTVEVYDPATDRWTSAPPLPTPRSGLTAAVLDGRIHVVGGEALSGGRTFEQHEVFDPRTGVWRSEAPLVPARHGLASAVADGRWYVIGGATRAGGGTFGSLTDRVSVWQGER